MWSQSSANSEYFYPQSQPSINTDAPFLSMQPSYSQQLPVYDMQIYQRGSDFAQEFNQIPLLPNEPRPIYTTLDGPAFAQKQDLISSDPIQPTTRYGQQSQSSDIYISYTWDREQSSEAIIETSDSLNSEIQGQNTLQVRVEQTTQISLNNLTANAVRPRGGNIVASLQRDSLRVDEFIKKHLMRDFRHALKKTFDMLFKNKRHYLTQNSKLKNVKNFFTGKVWDDYTEAQLIEKIKEDTVVVYVPDQFYEEHKDIFIKLVYSTKKQSRNLDLPDNATLRTIEELFDNKFNMDRLKNFIAIEAIQGLWWSGFNSEKPCWKYYDSGYMQDVKVSLPEQKRAEIMKTLNKKIELRPDQNSLIP